MSELSFECLGGLVDQLFGAELVAPLFAGVVDEDPVEAGALTEDT